ncbi:MmgE/PrpD family protein [Chitinophaga polysaccharea]|uniref:MmgE/PrpD family protein n=1 Tax=Chitinophaga polysaccharea TaxID=1293035 RepID=UPI001455CBC8|nr:MmgE/PrpD family protein [Chitinophaga polysaccharea]NLR59520.1 MmgE/PrpD family protein [Chitinophaga polysaccharea]
MKKETDLQNYQIAAFALNASYDSIRKADIAQLKRHLLDALGSFFFATTRVTLYKLVRQLRVLSDGGGDCVSPYGFQLAADRAAQLYTALIRVPDFMDNYIGKEATCHPSDNIGGLLAAAQLHPVSGREFLAAMAIAYQVQCRLIEEIPVMQKGIDHTLLLGYSLTAALSRMLGLTEKQTAHALGITGSSISPTVASRAAYTYEWKGFVSSFDAMNCINIVLLAREGLTGPIAIFEGPKGLDEVFNMKLDYDWSREDFSLLSKCILKRYNAEVHAQPTLEAVDDLRKQYDINPATIERIDIRTFLTAFHIIGSGAYGDRKEVYSKEQADHSLFYTVAALLLDKELYPAQFEPKRINRDDVQQLLKKVYAGTGFNIHKPVELAALLDPYTRAYPGKLKAKVTIHLQGGQVLVKEKEDYHGFYTRPFSWEDVENKFRKLTNGILSPGRQQEVIDVVRDLEHREASDLVELLHLEESVAG